MVLPRENPRPDRRPGENLRCGERTRARRKGTELGGRGQASRPAIRHAQFRGAAPYPAQKRGPHGIEIPWGEEEQRNE